MTVFVEASCLEDVHLKNNPIFLQVREKIRTFRDGKDDLTDKVDFIVCLGGDGTLLYASSLFQVKIIKFVIITWYLINLLIIRRVFLR